MQRQTQELPAEFLAQIEPTAKILIEEIEGFSTDRLREDLSYLTNLGRRIRELSEPAQSINYSSLLQCTKSLFNRLEPLTFEAEFDELELEGIGDTLFSLATGLEKILHDGLCPEFEHLDQAGGSLEEEYPDDPCFSFIDPFHYEKEELLRFIHESQEVIERLHRNLQRSGEGIQSPAQAEEFMRGIHGIKGTSAFFPELRGNITKYSHEVESVLTHWIQTPPPIRSLLPAALVSRILQVFELLFENLEGRLNRDFAPHPTLRLEPSYAAFSKWIQGAQINPESILASNLVPAGTDTLIRIPYTRIDQLVEDVHSLRLVTGRIQEKFRDHDSVIKSVKPVQDGLVRLQNRVLDLRLFPIGLVFQRFLRTTREHGKALGKEVRLEIRGSEIRIDQTTANTLSIPITHLVRNALDHGIELPVQRRKAGKPTPGNISLAASQSSNRLIVEITDDGKGIMGMGYRRDSETNRSELLDFLTRPGFSTLEEATTTSGRGMGLHIARREIEKHGGTLQIDTSPGEGTQFQIELPLKFYTTDCMLFRSAKQIFAVPLAHIHQITSDEGEKGQHKIHTSFARLLNPSDEKVLESYQLELVNTNREPFSLGIERCIGKERLLIRPLDSPFLRSLQFTSSAAVLPSGKLCCILDVDLLMEYLRSPNPSRKAYDIDSSTLDGESDQTMQRLFLDPDRGRVLSFQMGENLYAIPLHSLKEVLDYSVPMRLPKVPKLVLGLINLRGIPIPLINLFSNLCQEPVPSTPECILILQHYGTLTGVPITKLKGIQTLEKKDFSDTSLPGTSSISGYFTIRGRHGSLLNLRNLYATGIRFCSTEFSGRKS